MLEAGSFKCRWCEQTFSPSDGDRFGAHVIGAHHKELADSMVTHIQTGEPAPREIAIGFEFAVSGLSAVAQALGAQDRRFRAGLRSGSDRTWEEAWANEERIREAVPIGSTWRHLKRGTTYKISDIALFQDATGSGEHDMELVVVYWSLERRRACTRRAVEFLDGRFEMVSAR